MIGRPFPLGALAIALSMAACGRSEEGPPPINRADVEAFLQDAGLEKSSFSTYIRGKVLVLNRTDRAVEQNVQALLAPAMNARAAREVETVVWIDWSTQELPGEEYKTVFQKGSSKRVPAVVWNADLTVVDWTRKRLLGGPRITGSGPTEHYEKRSGEALSEAKGIAGPCPYDKVASFLAETARSIAVPP